MNQDSKETEDQFATRLRKKAIRCRDTFAERTVVSFFLDGLKPYAQQLARDSLSRNSRLTFRELFSMAQSYCYTHQESARDVQNSALKGIKRHSLVIEPIEQSTQVLAVQAEEIEAGSFPSPVPERHFRYPATAEPAQAERPDCRQGYPPSPSRPGVSPLDSRSTY